MQARGQRKTLVGEVVKNKMTKTVSVRVDRLMKHPKFNRYVRRSRTFMAHDEQGMCQPGDRVQIIESRPLSRHKRWRIMTILERAEGQDTRRNP
ncbi:MAG: 30S ribosomal protein S17 [Candidatus Tectomicrobia bacterium]|jgi:small subunit ribosomal protein S17|nr:30S ribosomal protein S17 [Candidatus Tectomicrobia bacterium]